MSKQLLENELLYLDWLKEFEKNEAFGMADEDMEELERGLEFIALKKLGIKFARLYRENKLEDGELISIKDRELPLLYVGKVFIESDCAGIGKIEVYQKG